MGADGLGTSVIIALAALLWVIYLVPTWFRRREYLATERNAVRLQQTVRVMAESAEVPEPVRVAVNARSVAAQQKVLKKMTGKPRYSRNRAASRLRRSRAIASLFLLVAIVAAGFGVNEIVQTGSWILLVASATVALGCQGLLQQAAAVARARTRTSASIKKPRASRAIHDEADFERQTRPWTPVPLPKPLYLRGVAVSVSAPEASIPMPVQLPAPNHVAILQADADRAEQALRASSRTAPTHSKTPQVASESRFTKMGYLDQPIATPNLDEILKRRRAAS